MTAPLRAAQQTGAGAAHVGAANTRAAAFWTEFCRAANVPTSTPYQSWYFGDSPARAHELAELVLRGRKRATAGSCWVTDVHPELGAVPHGYSVVTEFDGTPRCVVRTTWIDRRRMSEVDAQFAWDEGEGDRSLADWMAGHRRYFAHECGVLGKPYGDDMWLQLERFELLYPFDRAGVTPDGPRIVPGYLPGAAGSVAMLQAAYYSRHFGVGAIFESKVLRDISDFIARFSPARDGIWLVVDSGRVLGSIFIDGTKMGADPQRWARLRWFFLDESLRGLGLGRRLVSEATAFCRYAGHGRVFLNTFAGLDRARALYEGAGFKLASEMQAETWGRPMCEQRFEWVL